ncbi:unnamed protein product [Staurois parvus]|uniref:Uncharacterized protein n=1 Tax=Staurois parvus TaxID=386267 RepID=A0ABN9AVI3_9NEOB|nr:unnamed protein product [Staurois parvus]
MLVILTVEPKGVNPLHCVKTQIDSDFLSPSYLLIRHNVWSHSPHAQFGVHCWRFFFFLGRVHVISTGPISTVQTEVKGPASS